jgi:hypothetical protein
MQSGQDEALEKNVITLPLYFHTALMTLDVTELL